MEQELQTARDGLQQAERHADELSTEVRRAGQRAEVARADLVKTRQRAAMVAEDHRGTLLRLEEQSAQRRESDASSHAASAIAARDRSQVDALRAELAAREAALAAAPALAERAAKLERLVHLESQVCAKQLAMLEHLSARTAGGDPGANRGALPVPSPREAPLARKAPSVIA